MLKDNIRDFWADLGEQSHTAPVLTVYRLVTAGAGAGLACFAVLHRVLHITGVTQVDGNTLTEMALVGVVGLLMATLMFGGVVADGRRHAHKVLENYDDLAAEAERQLEETS